MQNVIFAHAFATERGRLASALTRWASGIALSSALIACGSDESKPGPTQPKQPPARDEWRSLGFDSNNTRNNRAERSINVSNVGSLKPKWILLDVGIGVTSTPAVVDGVVYFGEWGTAREGAGAVRAVKASDGSQLWRTTVRGRPRASPLVTDDRVFVSAGREVFALRRSDGFIEWSKVLDEHTSVGLDSSPIWADGTIVIGVASGELGLLKDDYTFRGSVVGLNAADGAERWRVYTTKDDATSGGGVSVWSSAAVDTSRRRIYIGTGNTYEEPASPWSDAILCIDYETGELVWTTQFTTGDVFVVPKIGQAGQGPDADIGASPNLFRAGGRDLVGAGSKAGLYKALDRTTGEVIWEREIGRSTPLGGIMTTSAIDDTAVYISSNTAPTSITTALSLKNGQMLWETVLPSPAYGALTLANGVLYQPTIRGTWYALDAKNGDQLFSADLLSDLGGGISVVNGTVYVPRGFSFLGTFYPNAGGLVAFSLDGNAALDFDAGAPLEAGAPSDAGSEAVSVDQCLTQQPATLTADCKDCACRCEPATVAGCDQRCWDLFSCVINNCASRDFSTSDGRTCVEQSCTDLKLVPIEVQLATLGAARCMVQCKDRCGAADAAAPSDG